MHQRALNLNSNTKIQPKSQPISMQKENCRKENCRKEDCRPQKVVTVGPWHHPECSLQITFSIHFSLLL